MARKAKVAVEEPVVSETPEIEESIVEEAVEEAPAVEAEEMKEEVVVEEAGIIPVFVDNHFADRLFEDRYARSVEVYDVITVTADKEYIRPERVPFLFQLVMQSIKSGGVAKFPKNYFENLDGAAQEDNFWIITKE